MVRNNILYMSIRDLIDDYVKKIYLKFICKL